MNADLLVRVVTQAVIYGELMLTEDEVGDYWRWTNEHPRAAFVAGPGRVLAAATIPIHLLTL